MPHASKTPAEAVEHYRGRTVRLLSCVTAVHVVVRAYHLSDTPHDLELADTAKMRGGPFSIDVAEEYEVRQDTDGWHVEIVGYLYAIGHEGRELVSYTGIQAATARSPGRTCTSPPTSGSAIGGSERYIYPPARSASSKSSRW